MPRPTRSHGRPGTEVIPADWATSHRPVAEKTMRGATVALSKPGSTQAWSEADGQMVAVPNPPYWTGQARIQELATRDQATITVRDREVTLRYLVAVPADVDPAAGDLASVTAVDDTHLQDRALIIAAVQTGSLRFERDLYCGLTD